MILGSLGRLIKAATLLIKEESRLLSMVIFHEDFMRCEHCGSPYFKKDEHFLINKDAYLDAEIIEEFKTNIIYTCKTCGTVFATIEKGE